MKKIFIDCGTNMFQGFEYFANKFNIDSTWECYSFEANPDIFLNSKEKYNSLIGSGYNIEHKNIAVTTFDGKVKINCHISDQHNGEASNILLNPPQRDIRHNVDILYKKTDEYVECIDFVKFLKSIYIPQSYILIKMDIEGAEFDILDSILEKLDLSIISDIYVEFHERFFTPQEPYALKIELYKQEFAKMGIVLNSWV